ncbi:MAG: ATP-binding protein [Paenibacillus sp.]|uniref:ATP-binding protein n=1 Tax=Paenibacillus sp. TaxID=58172 RepID=UPI00290789D6|nr:ATP-binding protein [Paenibacillus sp.]MDU4697559.1 ATP-binding protein [Paenibacillus sp.]
MLILVASFGLTGVALLLGYFIAGELQQVPYFAPPINWIINHAGSVRVLILAGIILFPMMFFLASRRLVLDLHDINTELQEISAGRFGVVTTVKNKDELGAIAESLNQLSYEWERYLTEITRGLEEIANGEFDHQIPEILGNQLGEVAHCINQMSTQLKHSIMEERKAEKTKNDLITGVSHDLRTPLTSILGFLEVIQEDRYQDEVEMRYYINIAYEKSLALRRLIDELFEYTRINNGMPLELSEIDIAGLIRQLADEFVPATENAGMVIRMNMQGGEFKIQADGGLLVRAYENIIANALQYGRAGKYIDIDIAQDRDMLVVRIQNYGNPIPEQDLPFIFDRFYRVDRSRSKQTGGTGLGLAITKSIVDVHGGCITAHSNRRATMFETRFPMSGHNKGYTAISGEVPNDMGRASTVLAEQGVSPRQRTFPRKRRLLQTSVPAILMILLLVCTAVLFGINSPFTSKFMTKMDTNQDNNDQANLPTKASSPMVIINGVTDHGYTLLIHDYMFNGQNLHIRYSMRHTGQFTDSEWSTLSVKPDFKLDTSTERAVPGIKAMNLDTIFANNGTLSYDFTEDPPPSSFTLKLNVKGLDITPDFAQQFRLDGDWSFELPIEQNYILKSNGQSSPL